MTYTIRYLASDGEIRWTEVDAENEEEAEEKLWEESHWGIGGGDDILEIIDIT